MDASGDLAPRPLPPGEREPWPSFLGSMFRAGVNTFGGPVAQIGVMHREAVERRGWLSDAQFMHLLNFANILPGPEALEISIHLGYLRRGVLGGIAAGLLFIWPGFVALTALAWIYVSYGEVKAVSGFLEGIRPVAVALIAFAVMRLALKTLKGIAAYAILTASFLANFMLEVQFAVLLVASGLLGLWLARWGQSHLERVHRPVVLTLIAAAITAGFFFHPSEANLRFASAEEKILEGASDPERPGTRGATGLGKERALEIAWVNTKAALLTFGGAYTVLPYLREQMVDAHGWVTDHEMVDALALGETTPGPLISIGIFLSYLAGGPWGGVVGCIFLFLPSFLLVLGLGRHIEKVETLPRARRFLWGVSAGTIGLILSLSAQLGPRSIGDPLSGLISGIAFVALWRYGANVLLTVTTGGLIGILRAFVP